MSQSMQRLIIIYSSGVCVLWDKVGHKVVKRAEITEKVRVNIVRGSHLIVI